jgi:hypothetical protein
VVSQKRELTVNLLKILQYLVNFVGIPVFSRSFCSQCLIPAAINPPSACHRPRARRASKIARRRTSAHMHMPPALPGATTKPDQACRAAQARAARSGGRWNLAILDGGQSAAGLDALRSNSPCVCMRACRSSFYFGLLPGAAGQWNVCAKLKYAYINLARASRKDQGGGFPLSRPRQIRNWRWLN